MLKTHLKNQDSIKENLKKFKNISFFLPKWCNYTMAVAWKLSSSFTEFDFFWGVFIKVI